MSEEITQTAPVTTEETQQEVEIQSGNEVEIANSFVNGKYKSVSDLEKGYENLQKRFGSFTGAPEEYSMAEDISINAEHPLLAQIQAFGKENNLSNEGYNNLVGSLLESEKALQEQAQAQAEEVMKGLGPNAKERIQNIDDFVNANVEANDDMKSLIDAAKEQPGGVELLEAFIKMSKGTAPASEQVVSPVKTYTKDELNKLQFATDDYGNRKMASDPAYRKMVDDYTAKLLAQG